MSHGIVNVPFEKVTLLLAPKSIFERNLVEQLNGKTYKPTLEELTDWHPIVGRRISANDLIMLANLEEAVMECPRSPFVGDVVVIENPRLKFIKRFVLAPGGGFWELTPDPPKETNLQKICRQHGWLLILADQGEEPDYCY